MSRLWIHRHRHRGIPRRCGAQIFNNGMRICIDKKQSSEWFWGWAGYALLIATSPPSTFILRQNDRNLGLSAGYVPVTTNRCILRLFIDRPATSFLEYDSWLSTALVMTGRYFAGNRLHACESSWFPIVIKSQTLTSSNVAQIHNRKAHHTR